jgi:hypothetical protein
VPKSHRISIDAEQRAELDPVLICQLVILLGYQFAEALAAEGQFSADQAAAAAEPDSGEAASA